MKVAMPLRETETVNRKVTAPYVSEIKVTALVERAIDAPVEKNPVRPASGGAVKRQGMPITASELNLETGYNTRSRYE